MTEYYFTKKAVKIFTTKLMSLATFLLGGDLKKN